MDSSRTYTLIVPPTKSAVDCMEELARLLQRETANTLREEYRSSVKYRWSDIIGAENLDLIIEDASTRRAYAIIEFTNQNYRQFYLPDSSRWSITTEFVQQILGAHPELVRPHERAIPVSAKPA